MCFLRCSLRIFCFSNGSASREVGHIVVRVVGKISGAYFSAKAVHAPPTVVKYLGFTLIPQAGVAIDMAITADQRFETIVGLWFDRFKKGRRNI